MFGVFVPATLFVANLMALYAKHSKLCRIDVKSKVMPNCAMHHLMSYYRALDVMR